MAGDYIFTSTYLADHKAQINCYTLHRMGSRRLKTNLVFFSIIVFCFSFVSQIGHVAAETYNVNASVPYEAPTQAATVTSPSNGSVFQAVQQTITGTCQVKDPPTIVSVWRGDVVLGSTECSAGSFSLPVILRVGQNTLVVRTANVSAIYGPDSGEWIFTVENPAPVEPLPPGVSQPPTTTSHQAATNQGGISGLIVTTEAPYTVMSSAKTASIRVIVSGGQRPYVLQLKWGDGSTESHSLDQAGAYEFTHTYLAHKTYSVSVYVRDVLGSYTEYTYAIVSGQKAPTSSAASQAASGKQSAGPWRLVGVVWYYWLFIIFAIIFFLSSYILGYRRGRNRSNIEAEKRAVAKKQKKKAAKK